MAPDALTTGTRFTTSLRTNGLNCAGLVRRSRSRSRRDADADARVLMYSPIYA